MNILYCGDHGVEKGIALSALSLCRHSKEPLTFYLLTASYGEYEAISGEFVAKLERIVSAEGHRVILTDLTERFCKELPLANLESRFTPLCMLRLYADTVPQLPDRILYLDADVLCRGDFSPLMEIDLSRWELAGVPDRYGKWFYGNLLRHDYLNSGVLLMNLEQIRESGLLERCRKLCREKRMLLPDQAALNRLAKKTRLPAAFNCQGRIRSDTVLKHFTTFFRFFPRFRAVSIKPWQREKMHAELGIFEFDDLLDFYEKEFEA